MNQRSVSLLLVLITCVALSACSQLTSQNWAKIKIGMKAEEVKAILGKPDSTLTHGAVGLISITYIYHANPADIKVIFLNDQVIAKTGNL